MSLKVSAEDIIPCVYRFLLKFGHTAAAKALEKSAEVEPRGGISTKKLLKIAKFYLKHHPELIAKEESEEEEEVKPVKTKKTEKTVNGKRKPTKEESEEEEEEEEKPVKESKKKIKTEKANGIRKQSKTIEEEDDEEEEEETTKKSQKNKVKEHAPIKEKSAAKATKVVEEEDDEEDQQVSNHTGRFSYVDHSVLEGVPTHLQDNTFESKTLYGNGGDAFGQFGHERLIHTRGKGFTKEKNKLKNKQFHGGAGRINAFVQNSIKLSYSDDE